MKKLFLIMMIGTIVTACTGKSEKSDNPFFSDYKNEYKAPPFESIKNAHYLPAFEEGIKQHQAEIDSIASNPEAPTFANTIEAMEYSGELLSKVSAVFSNLQSAETNDEMDSIAKIVTPKLTEHSDNIYLNDKLFQRVRAIFDTKATLGLTPEQDRLLEKIYKRFIRSGAALNEEQKAQLREINKELSTLELTFGQNILAETNAFKKFVTNKEELKGLPEGIIEAAAEEAKKEGTDEQ